MTPLMSDTFFGHFCWALFYHEGGDLLTDFLKAYGNGKPAPVLFSSAFLSGHLPRPDIPPPPRDKLRDFIRRHFGESKRNLFEGLSKIREWNKRRFLSSDQWLRLKEDYSDIRLYKDFITEGPKDPEDLIEIEISASNTIDRISGTILEEDSGFFHKERLWYHQAVTLDIYVEVNDEEIDKEVRWFLTSYLPENGFGADKSAGMGALSIEPDTDFDPEVFSVAEPNAGLSLSLASFQGIEEVDAFYRLKTKFGKLGGNFSFSGAGGQEPRPFKRPLLMYEPGAVFLSTENFSCRPLLENVHSDKRIRHCGIPITLPMRIKS